MDEVTPNEARASLAAVGHSRLAVVDRIRIPPWYWWSVALGWIVLAAITDLQHPLLTTVATLVFGTAHAAIASRAVDGRHGDPQLAVRGDVVGRRVAPVVIAGLIVLAGVTIAVALALDADGAGHPVTGAGILVAVIVLLGGPLAMSQIRQAARVAALA